jgi:O-antigen/teichoic acid export membrane protein
MSLSKSQFIRNSIWTFLELALYPILMIVATPIFIKKLGIEQYGLWMLVSTITLGMNVLNIGVGDTNIRLISKYRAEENSEAIKKVFNHNFSLSIFLFFLSALIGTLFYYCNFITFFYKGNDFQFAGVILLLACLSAGGKFIEISILSFFKAYERFDINSKLVLLSKNSVTLLNLLLVALNYNLIDIFVSTVFINVFNISFQLIVLNKFKPQTIIFPSLMFLKDKLDYLNYNVWYWLQSSIALFGFLADKLLVAYFTDVKTLGYYSIASLIGIQIHNFFLAFGSFIFPRVSYKLAANKSLASLYFVARGFVAIPGWFIISILILFGDVIFKVWLGAETFEGSIYFIKLYLVFEAAILLIIVPFYFINGTARIKLNSLFEIAMRSSHMLGMMIGYYLDGVSGIIYGLIFSTFVNIPFQYYFFHKKIIPEVSRFQFALVLVPVFFMFGIIIFDSLFFKLSLVLGLIICVKLIYFDSAKKHSKNISLFVNGFKTPATQ